MPLLLLDRPTLTVQRVGPAAWPDGVLVVRAAQAATGIPATTPEALVERTLRRQHEALGVWHAEAWSARGGSRVVGHALCETVAPDDPAWSLVEDRVVRRALRGGRLVALGGLAVAPGWTGRGIAASLVRARLDHLSRRDLVACAAVWDTSAGSLALAHTHGRPVGRHPDRPLGLFVYDR